VLLENEVPKEKKVLLEYPERRENREHRETLVMTSLAPRVKPEMREKKDHRENLAAREQLEPLEKKEVQAPLESLVQVENQVTWEHQEIRARPV